MPLTTTIEVLDRLIGFDTTSRNSNLDLIDWAEDWLTGHGARCRRVPDETGTKANLWATIGPEGVPGWVLSGHTDVVPVDGQVWASDPFRLDRRGSRLYGRGTTDMKGFNACAMALVPGIDAARLARPIHLALSYDEEVGCIGVRGLIAAVAGTIPTPLGCIVGEPTQMRVCTAHKAKRSLRARFSGTAGHSSRAPEFVNAVEYAARLAVWIQARGRRLATEGGRDALFDTPHSTVHLGVLHGGTALNIVPDDCVADFEFRILPGEDADALVAEVTDFLNGTLLPEMRATDPAAGIALELLSAFPGLDTDPAAPVVTTLQRLTGHGGHIKVAYGTEAGLFHAAGFPSVVCGPGSINEAHKPDEFIEESELAACGAMLRRLLTECVA